MQRPVRPKLVVLNGLMRGVIFTIPLGRSVLSLTPSGTIELGAPETSHHQAVLEYAQGHVLIAGPHRHPAVRVNDSQLTSQRELYDGDVVVIGAAELQFRGVAEAVRERYSSPANDGSRIPAARLIYSPENGAATTNGASQESRARDVAVGKTLAIAAVCAIVPLIGNVAASFLTTWTGVATWLAVPAIGVGVAMVNALIQAYGSAPHAEPARSRTSPYPVHPARTRRPLPLALVSVLLVIGVGGLALTAGIRYAVGYATGNEPGTSQLVGPATATGGGLVLTVQSVTYTAHFTRIDVAARNQTAASVSLPLFDNCVLTGSEGTTLEADPFRSHWSETLAPGSLQSGVVIFSGHLPASIRQASLSFAQIFGPGGGSITVRGLQLRPG
jgi:hypothetical protein